MDLYNQLKGLSERIEQSKKQITTEESTKHAFVLPFIQLLGYDVFNPLEVCPEFTADVGIKKGEKVDYAIFQNGEPILIIECKHWNSDLNVHNSSQLFRYFHVTKTRFALLTNGITYKFYTDLQEPNKMDEKPFFEFCIEKLKESTSKELEKFHKSNFDVYKILDSASSLKYTSEVKNIIETEFKEPPVDFVRYFASKVYSGRLMPSVIDEFSEIVKKAFSQYVNEKINDRLNSAINKERERQQEQIEASQEENEEESKICTTEEELEAYRIVLAILRRKVEIERIFHRDTQTYFGILLDDNNRKPICRFHFNTANKYIEILDENKKGTKHLLESLNDIYKYEDELLAAIDYYE